MKRRRMSPRRRDLAVIHIAAAQLFGDDREAYEDAVEAAAGVRSTAGLDADGRRRVIAHLRDCGARIGRAGRGSSRRPRPRPEIARLVRKIDAMCINHPGGRKPRKWAEGILRQMTGADSRTPLEWAGARQLRDVVSAISIDIRRRGRRERAEGRPAAAAPPG